MQEDNFQTEKNVASLWAKTLKEHGRDDESKKGINDFFITILGLDRDPKQVELERLSIFKKGMIVEYYSYKREKWVDAIVTDLELDDGVTWVYDVRTHNAKLAKDNLNPVRYKAIKLEIPELTFSPRTIQEYDPRDPNPRIRLKEVKD